MSRAIILFLASLFVFLSLATADEPTTKIAKEDHWSLKPRSHPVIPSFANPEDSQWVRNPIDAFILDALKTKELRPAAEADRTTLLRRVKFDLTGLPPTPEEVKEFVEDIAPDAYEKLVDRLLASPQYGERWGRHWLDVVRFAESEGFEYDRRLSGLWRYRDYVIRCFNEDKPFDEFVTEQLAGDEMVGDKQDVDDNDRQKLIAAGFYRLGPVRRNAGNQNVASSRHEILVDRTDVIGAAFLGLTVGCARCHNHKYDAIPQVDYYRMQAFLAEFEEQDVLLKVPGQEEAKKAPKGKGGSSGPVINTVRNDPKTRLEVFVLRRGDLDKKEEQVGIRALSALVPKDVPELPADTANPRSVLAKWITLPDHPLTARVIVNRLWQYHFGHGIVETANDFGINGARPTHPELLDHLANQLVAGGWKLKSIQRAILLSSTYRQSNHSAISKDGETKDPDDKYLWHFPRQRLEAEEVRDAMLSVAGALNPKAGGPSVILPADKDLVKLLYDPKQWIVTGDASEHNRRSVYLVVKRNLRLPFAEVFDQPDTLTSCSRRESSTHALQALEMLNGTTSNQLAKQFAERLQREAGDDVGKQVEFGYLLATGRLPNTRERELGAVFVREHPLPEFCLALFNLNAFLYVE